MGNYYWLIWRGKKKEGGNAVLIKPVILTSTPHARSCLTLTWEGQAGWCGSCSAAVAGWGSAAAGRAAAVGGASRRTSPSGEDALCLLSGREGCTGGTSTSSPEPQGTKKLRQDSSLFCRTFILLCLGLQKLLLSKTTLAIWKTVRAFSESGWKDQQ